MQFLRDLNLFPSVPPSTDHHQLQNERISTRLFILFLFLSLAILVFYTSLVTVTQTVNVQEPTLSQYSQLFSTYPQTLTCACTQISIGYDTFLHVNYTLHQVCNSDFVTQNWIDYILDSYAYGIPYSLDFRLTSPASFQLLRVFCELVNNTIVESLVQFYANAYVSASVIPSRLFGLQAQSLIDQFISSTTNNFVASLQMIRDTTQGNALYSALEINYGLYIWPGQQDAFSYPYHYANCSCASTGTCVLPSAIFSNASGSVVFFVPGFYVGCYVVESLLQSNLECFYSQHCLDQLQSHIISTAPMNVTALDSSASTNSTTATIQQLLGQLMVDHWNRSVIYESYYGGCQPAQCIYTHETKNDAAYIITTILGLVGGLVTILKLIVPRIVRLVARCVRRVRRVGPEPQINGTLNVLSRHDLIVENIPR